MRDLDLFHEDRTMPEYRGIVRQRAEQMVRGEIDLGMFVRWLQGEAVSAERERIRTALEAAGWREDSDFSDKWPVKFGWGSLESDLDAILDGRDP